MLRTLDTIERFKRVPVQPGTTSPLLIYFGTILTKSSLNSEESVELGKLVMSQNKKPLLDNWWKVRGWVWDPKAYAWGSALARGALLSAECLQTHSVSSFTASAGWRYHVKTFPDCARSLLL